MDILLVFADDFMILFIVIRIYLTPNLWLGWIHVTVSQWRNPRKKSFFWALPKSPLHLHCTPIWKTCLLLKQLQNKFGQCSKGRVFFGGFLPSEPVMCNICPGRILIYKFVFLCLLIETQFAIDHLQREFATEYHLQIGADVFMYFNWTTTLQF